MTIHLSIHISPAIPAGPGEIGCKRPAVWRHFLRQPDGSWLFSQLFSDTNHGQPPDCITLASHARNHPDRWLPITDPTTPTTP